MFIHLLLCSREPTLNFKPNKNKKQKQATYSTYYVSCERNTPKSTGARVAIVRDVPPPVHDRPPTTPSSRRRRRCLVLSIILGPLSSPRPRPLPRPLPRRLAAIDATPCCSRSGRRRRLLLRVKLFPARLEFLELTLQELDAELVAAGQVRVASLDLRSVGCAKLREAIIESVDRIVSACINHNESASANGRENGKC